MNTAARVIQQQSLTIRSFHWAIVAQTSAQWMTQILLFLVLFSALATVIATSKTRGDYRTLQSYQQYRAAEELQQGRLLLEKSTLLAQARVSAVARSQSGMRVPEQKMLIVVQ